jgi:hypothetical protein
MLHKALCQQADQSIRLEHANGVQNGLRPRTTSTLFEVHEPHSTPQTPTLPISPITQVPEVTLPVRQPEVKQTNEVAPEQPGLWSKAATEKERVQVTTTPVPDPSGLRVLLVEDNEINLKLLVAYMRKLKLYHTTATNGLEALDAYKECNGKFDVVFMGSSSPIHFPSPLPLLTSHRYLHAHNVRHRIHPAYSTFRTRKLPRSSRIDSSHRSSES